MAGFPAGEMRGGGGGAVAGYSFALPSLPPASPIPPLCHQGAMVDPNRPPPCHEGLVF